MPAPFDDRDPAQEIRRLLDTTPVIHNSCDLDLLVFLHRHPRTLLTSEQLSEFVGYDLIEIAKSLDGFIGAGLLARTAQPSAHAARLYLLLLDGPEGKGLSSLIELARTRQGRQSIIDVLKGGRPPRPVQSEYEPRLRLAQ